MGDMRGVVRVHGIEYDGKAVRNCTAPRGYAVALDSRSKDALLSS